MIRIVVGGENIYYYPSLPPPTSHTQYTVVVFAFSGGGSSTRERDGVINVEVTYNVAIAVPVSLIATPVKYSPDLPLPPDLLDAISEYNALNNPNIATR